MTVGITINEINELLMLTHRSNHLCQWSNISLALADSDKDSDNNRDVDGNRGKDSESE